MNEITKIILMTQFFNSVLAECSTNCNFGCIDGSCYGQCTPGYMVHLNDDKYVCEKCENDICLDCGQGYYQEGVTCQKCMPQCQQCITKQQCSCKYPCLICNKNGCLECAKGYERNKHKCERSTPLSMRDLSTVYCSSGYQLFLITATDCTNCAFTTCSSYNSQYNDVCLGVNQPLPPPSPIPTLNCSTCTRYQCMLCTIVSSAEVCYQCNPNYCVDIQGVTCTVTIGNYCDSDPYQPCNITSCTPCPTSCKSCSQGACNCATSGDSSITSYQMDLNCSTCSDGYYQSGDYQCLICPSTCNVCTQGQCYCLTSLNQSVTQYQLDNSTCKNCLDGYYQSPLSECIICPSICKTCDATTCLTCNSPCQTCSFTTCITCINSYYLSGISCVPCNSTCSTCTSAQCLTCVQSNYYPAAASTTNNCLPCNSTCLTCNISRCITCIASYYISGTQCCYSTCATCTTTECLTCLQTNYYVSGNKCIVCDTSCSTCNVTICLTCIAQSMYVSGTKCLNCNTGCSACDSISCFNCIMSNQYPLGTNCVNCPNQCKVCDGNTCQQCLYPCTQCNMQQCTQCASGYYLNRQNICIRCDPQCQICDQNGCITCLDTYQLIINQCIICDPNCTTCILSNQFQQGYCLKCEQTYYLNQFGYCQQCPPNCLTCSDGTTCLICSNPLNNIESNCLCNLNQFQKSDLSCLDCQYPCTQCKSLTYCTQCASLVGLYLNNYQCICQPDSYQLLNGQCQLCPSNCETCSSQGCLSCLSIQYRTLQNNTCICQSGYIDIQQDICLDCNSTQGQIIQQCKYSNCGDGYWTYGEKCDDGNNYIRDGCSNCQIDPQYYCINTILQPSICYQCDQNCQTCNQQGCLSCIDQYKLIENTCQLICPDNCLICSVPNKCDKCKYLYEPTSNFSCQLFQQENLLNQQKDYDINIGGSGYNNSMIGLATLMSQNAKLNNLTIQLTSGYEYQLKSILIDFFSQSSFTYQYNIIQGNLNINFTFFESIQTINLIHLNIVQMTSQTRLLQENPSANQILQITVIPSIQTVYTDDQAAQIAQVQQIQSSLTSTLSILGPFTVAFGGFGTYMNILQIVAWVSNLYYINVNYPGNVETFFEYMSLNSILQLPSFFTFNQPTDDYYRPSPQRFVDQGYDPLYINNMQQILFVTLLLLMLKPMLIVYKTCKRSFNNRRIKHFKFNQFNKDYQISSQSLTSKESMSDIIFRYIDTSLKDFHKYYNSYLFQNISVNLLDICLSIALQLTYQVDVQYLIVLINVILSIISGWILIYCFYKIYESSNKHIKLLQLETYMIQFDSIYEGINLETQIGKKYGVINIFRKMAFILVLVALYDIPILQSILCSLVNSLQVIILLYENPFYSRRKYLEYGVPDIFMCLAVSLTIVFAIDDQYMYLSQETRFQIGWIVLAAIFIQISIQLLFILLEFCKNIKSFCFSMRQWINS